MLYGSAPPTDATTVPEIESVCVGSCAERNSADAARARQSDADQGVTPYEDRTGPKPLDVFENRESYALAHDWLFVQQIREANALENVVDLCLQ